VILSILCALLAAAFLTFTLYSAGPVMKIVIEGQDLRQYVADRTTESQLGVTLLRDADEVSIARVKDGGVAAEAGVEVGDDPVTLQPMLAAAGEPSLPFRLAADIVSWLPTDPVETVAALVGVIVVLATFGHGFRFCQEFFSEKASVSATNDLRRTLYGRVLRLPMAYFGRFGTSDVTSRLTTDALNVQNGLKMLLGRGIQEPLNAVAALILALILDWRLTAFIVIFVPITVVLMRKLGKKVGRAAKKELAENADMLGQIEASLDGIRVVKSAAAEGHEESRYGHIMNRLQRQQLKAAKYDALTGPILEILATAAVGAVAVLAAYLVRVQGTLDATQFILILACLAAIGEALRKLSKMNNVLQRANAGAGRIFEAADLAAEGDAAATRPDCEGGWSAQPASTQTPPEMPAAPATLPDGRASLSSPFNFATIAFDDVRFGYDGAIAPAVDGVSFAVERGESVAVVGRNGSGKTTLLAMLPRFFDPDAGRITIDDRDLRVMPLPVLRGAIGVVTQEGALFPGTIAQNIAYGEAEPDLAKVKDAAERAFAAEFIAEKGGYDAALVGQNGGLSGGQRQRLNIARAIYRDAPILILDEATSQVDAESEHLIQKALDELMSDRTTFVIAHRFSTITKADKIVVMDAGRVVGQGTHAELMTTCPTYQKLYDRQLTAA
jgi:ABC-type multidrug transport system fused ATPase/permease subunit